MNSNEKQPPANPAAPQGQQQYFPPPPPGPPPAQSQPGQTNPPKHTNETPLPEYDIPGYNPSHPQFAAPPTTGDDDIYNASPTTEHPPKWGFHHKQDKHDKHDHSTDAEGKKKSNRLSAFGEAFASKVAGPVNALANKFGSEGFLPESLDKECEKAARILRGFCKDGIYSDIPQPTGPTPAATSADKPPPSPSNKPKKSRVLLTIPSKVIARAQGLAIFTAVRVGFQATGSSGSGVLLARLPDGSWSPPSAIQITSIGAGFVAGVDIYDCVIVINTREALDLFTRTRMSLGSDLAVTAGPFGAGGALDWGVQGADKNAQGKPTKPKQAGETPTADTLKPPAPLSSDNTHFQTPPIIPEHEQGMDNESYDRHDHKDKPSSSASGKTPDRRPSPFREALKKPVYSYVKSRGFYAGVQIDGTVIAARDGANAKFYGQAVPVAKILSGEVPAQVGSHGQQGVVAAGWPGGARGLFEVLRGAEGWRGQGQQPPVSPGFGYSTGPGAGTGVGAGYTNPTPSFGNPAGPGSGGAPQSAWVPPPTAAPAPGEGHIPAATAGIQNLHLGAGGPSTTTRDIPTTSGTSSTIPPPPPTAAGATGTAGASAKAAEAAADAGAPAPPPPPMYTETHVHGAGEELPPAYVEEEERHRGVGGGDSKTGQH